ncbi:hypothetical protein SDC9_157808 [bioreactor metagenome]|uniref:Uncharacterized protein n=1 Tax=bioreactor metagenome TaxID=1076179 RepID=A0A645FDP5_9ZZZZ
MVCRAIRDDGIIPDNAASERVAHRDRCLSVFSVQVILHFIWDHFVTFSRQNIENSLRPDHLAHWGDQRRKAQVRSDAGHFPQHSLVLIAGICLFELRIQVRQHSARYLIDERFGID